MALRRGGGNRDATPGPAGRHEEEQSTGRFGGKAEDHTPDRYKMREKLLSIGDDFWIETMKGRRAYKVDGKALRLRNTLVLEDPRGNAVYEIQAKVVAIKDTMAVSKPHGRDVAVVKHALISPLRDKMSANMADGPDIDIRGNILNHEYTMERRGKRICGQPAASAARPRITPRIATRCARSCCRSATISGSKP